jgi:iron complex transport system substrate-binding protein
LKAALRALLLAMALGLMLAAHGTVAAERVVSLNLCTDQMLVLLAPEKVAALSPLARDPSLSFVAAEARSFPVVRPTAEAVLRLRPDLVLGAAFAAHAALTLLEQEGVPVLRVKLGQDFAGIRAETLELGAVLGEQSRAEALLATMDMTLRSLPHPQRPPSAIVWEPHGFTAGPGSLMDAVLRAAGYVNAGAGRRTTAEQLLRSPPDLLVVPKTPGFPSLATDALDDPALTAIPRRPVSPALAICPGPFTALAARQIAR